MKSGVYTEAGMSKAALSTGSNVNGSLKWEVFVAPGIRAAVSDLPPGTKQGMWSPISSTLIYGERDAVLVDAFITVEQADALVDWVEASGKNLTTIYITHGHGDHFFGIGALLDRFPNARAVATPDVVKLMRQQVSPDAVANFWSARFPGQIPDQLVVRIQIFEFRYISLVSFHCFHLPVLFEVSFTSLLVFD
jgi:glyoxylase-like metal-dependent hydrolase (beta-lactamase superfamily II)